MSNILGVHPDNVKFSIHIPRLTLDYICANISLESPLYSGMGRIGNS